MTDTISTLAQKLRPHWLRDLGNGSGGVVATGGGGMSAHALDGVYHTGELAESQAPWAATKDELAAIDVHDRLHDVFNPADHYAEGDKWQIAGFTNLNDWGKLTPLADVTGATNEAVLKSDGSGHVSIVRGVASDRLRTPLIDTASGNMTIQPAGDVVLDPGGSDVLPGTNYTVNLGAINKKYLTLWAAELWVETLVAQDTIATIGGRVLIGPTTTLTRDLAPADTQVYVKHNQMVSGDKVYMEAAGKVEFMNVTSAATTISTNPPEYRYNVTRNLDGSGANQWYAGDALFNTGQVGNGFIDLYSISGIPRQGQSGQRAGPTIVGNVRMGTNYNNFRERWAVGNLNALYDYGNNEYGAAFGNPVTAWLGLDEVNGVRIMAGSTKRAQLDISGNFNIYDSSGTAVIALDNAGGSYFAGVMTIGTSGEIRQGTGTLGSNYTGLRIWRDSNVGRIGGYKSNVLQWYADTAGEMRAGAGLVAMAADGFSMARYATEVGTPISGTESRAALAWWDNIDSRTGSPLARIYAGRSDAGTGAVPSLSLEVDPGNATAGKRGAVWLTGTHPGYGNAPSLQLVNVYTIVGIPGIYPRRTYGTTNDFVDFSGTLTFQAHLLRDSGNTAIDIGTAGNPFRTLYATNVIATSISGTAMTGQEWEYAGSMLIDATAAGNTTVTVSNSGTGRADLDVDRNITLGGTVDGVDLAAFYTAYGTHNHDSLYVPLTRTLTAGNGLTGGGTLAADRSFAVGAGTLITVGATTVSLSNGTAQYQAIVTGGSPFTPAYTALSTFAGNGLSFSGGQYVVGAGTLVTVGATTVGLANGSAQYQVPVTGASPFTPAYAALSTFAGNGMSFSGGQYVIGTTGLGLDTTSTQVRLTSSSNPGATAAILATNSSGALTLAQLTISAAGYLYMDGVIDFGANTITEDATYLQFAGAKPLHFAQNIGNANWTVYNAGGADFGGSVNITGSSNLYVSGTVGGAAGVLQTLNDRVGVLCVPDPQFALDVNGPCRAQYFIGPHAIQLKDALLIAHYDGPEHGPYGEPNGHMGQPASISGDVVFRYGKFNKAVEITDSYTNLVSNPSFETNTTGWADYSNGTAAGTRTRTDEEAFDGYYSYRFAKTGGATADVFGARLTMTVTSGATYNVSAWVKLAQTTGATTNVARLYSFGGTGVNAFSYTDVVGEWVRLTQSVTANGTSLQVHLTIGNCTSGTVYFDAVQVTQTSAPRPFFAGARSQGSLTYANLSPNWSKLTVMCWFRAAATAAELGRNIRLFEVRNNDGNRINLRINYPDNYLAGYAAGGGTTAAPTGAAAVSAQTWHHAALVVDKNNCRIYFDGAEVGTAAFAGVATGLATAWVGMFNAGERLNGMVDEFAIINHAATATEIRAIYESNAPVFAETSTWSWRATPTGLVWADENGLWMRDTGGNAVLGVYGGAAGSYSWGGATLDTGDLLIGRANAYVLWDNSAATMEVAGTIKATAGYIGGSTDGWAITSGQLSSANIALISGANATIQTGTGSNLAGITTGSASGDWVLWAGTAHNMRHTAPFRLTLGGSLTATDATITGVITANSGAIGGAGGWTITTGKIYSDNIEIVSGASARIVVGGSTNWAGIHTGSISNHTIFWAGSAYGDRASAPFRVWLNGRVYATDAFVTGDIRATSGYIGGSSDGWAIGTGQLTSTGIGLYSGAAGTARLEVGSGSNTAGVVSGTSAGDVVMWAGSTYANRANVGTPFRVQANGAFYSTAGTLDNVSIVSGTITQLRAGAAAVQLGTDGQRFVLPTLTASPDHATYIPGSSSALRWFPTIDGTHDSTKNYAGLVAYKATAEKVVDLALISYAGTGDSDDHYSRVLLMAGHQNGGTYSDARLEVVRDPIGGTTAVTVTAAGFYTSGYAYITGNCSAQSFTDRTPHYDGDALADLRRVRGKKGEIDHSSLPAFARRQVQTKDGKTEDGRDLGAMISILATAIGQLEGRIAALEGRQ